MTRAKFLCPTCGELRKITDGTMTDPAFTLECGHTRSRDVPPLKANRVSIENLNTPAGRIAFPPMVVTQ